MEEATIVRWIRATGDTVEAEETLLELETDKALVDVPSPVSGILEIAIPSGEVGVEQVIAWITNSQSDISPANSASKVLSSSPTTAESRSPVSSVPGGQRRATGVIATPAAKRRAAELSVDLSLISGTGPGGRITSEDVEAAVEDHSPVTASRKALAENVTKSWQAIPHIYISRNMNVDGLAQAKRMVYKDGTSGVTYTDLILYSIARVLVEFPQVAATGEHVQPNKIHVSFAVATRESSVVTPVIQDANQLSLCRLSEVRRELTELALSRRLHPGHLAGGQFTVTNLGMEEVDFFAPIICAPQRAILAVGRIAQNPVVEEERLVVGWRMWASLAADHRYIDGVVAARFLTRWQQQLQRLPEDLSK
jgi:pyruvate dehydrogenase E2 component (dihydrolipoamide acetyltransferase)